MQKKLLNAQPRISAQHLTSIQQAVSASRAPNPFAGFTMSDIQEAAPENSLTDFPKDVVFFRVVYRNLALMLFCCKINITTVAENGENLINAHSQGPKI